MSAYFTLWHYEGHEWHIYTRTDFPSRDAAETAAQEALESGEECVAVTEGSRYPSDADRVR